MFWGLIMEPNKRYSQTVESAFHVSMATLDVTTADDDIVQVMLCYDNRNYLLCNLKKSSHCQVPLDLNFKEGTKIAFTSSGRGHVHLTGYLIPEDDEFDDQDLDDEAEDDEDEDIPNLISDKLGKRKAISSPAETKATKKLKQSINKKVKVESEEEDDDDDEDEEEGEGVNTRMHDTLEVDEDDEDDDDDDDDDEEEDEDDSDDDNEEDEDDEDEEEEEESSLPIKSKPEQKNKQQQQLQNNKQKNQSRKSDAMQNSMVNGKDVKGKKVKKEEEESPQNEQMYKKKVLTGGVQIEDLKMGNGAPAKSGKFVSVYYVGRLKNGKKFDATTSGDGFKFRLGKGEVIKGWDIGVQGMKVGGKRRITIPPSMAYGNKGSPPVIPGNSTLIFEVELRNVH